MHVKKSAPRQRDLKFHGTRLEEFIRLRDIHPRKISRLCKGMADALGTVTRSEMKSDELNQPPAGEYEVLANEVLSYLVKHPEAQDTLEGIAEWWLLEQRVFEVMGNLKVVLNDLVDRRFLRAVRSKDGRFSYRLNREMEREIRSHLRSSATTARPPKRLPSKE